MQSSDAEYNPLSEKLYHSTSLDAIVGILERKTLRATNIH